MFVFPIVHDSKLDDSRLSAGCGILDLQDVPRRRVPPNPSCLRDPLLNNSHSCLPEWREAITLVRIILSDST